MANVHRLDEVRNHRANQGRVPSRPAPAYYGSPDRMDILSPGGDRGDPRMVSHTKTVQQIICPYFDALSFVFLISLIEIAIYLATLTYSLLHDKGLSPEITVFLGPCLSTLSTFGAKVFCFILVL